MRWCARSIRGRVACHHRAVEDLVAFARRLVAAQPAVTGVEFAGSRSRGTHEELGQRRPTLNTGFHALRQHGNVGPRTLDRRRTTRAGPIRGPRDLVGQVARAARRSERLNDQQVGTRTVYAAGLLACAARGYDLRVDAPRSRRIWHFEAESLCDALDEAGAWQTALRIRVAHSAALRHRPQGTSFDSAPHRKTPRRSTSRSTHCAPNAHESACHSAGARRGQRLPPLATPSARLMPCAQLLRCPRVSAVRRERGYRVCLDAAVERPSARPLRRRRISCVAIAGRVSIEVGGRLSTSRSAHVAERPGAWIGRMLWGCCGIPAWDPAAQAGRRVACRQVV